MTSSDEGILAGSASVPTSLSSSAADQLVALAARKGVELSDLVEAAVAFVGGVHLGQARVLLAVSAGDSPSCARVLDLDESSSLLENARGRVAEPAPTASGIPIHLSLRGFRTAAGMRPAYDLPAPDGCAPSIDVLLDDAGLTFRPGPVTGRWLAVSARMARHVRRVLLDAVSSPDAPLGDIRLLELDEERTVLVDWNRTGVDDGPASTVPRIFESFVRIRPDAPAVISSGDTARYDQLDLRANRLAWHLESLGVRPGVVVGVCLARSTEAIVALLGILKAGGTYLPLDPGYPLERLEFMISDARARMVLTDRAHALPLPAGEVPLRILDDEASTIATRPGTRPGVEVSPDDVAYVMYTSGSTGVPKGVEVRHRSIERLVRRVAYVRLGPDARVLHAAPLAFDASTFEIWGPLLNGGACVLHDEPVPTARGLGARIRRDRVTTLWLTAGLFNAVVDDDPGQLEGVEQLLTGGEALSVPHVRRALRALPRIELINGYGPTETTTFATCHSIPRDLDPEARSIPIGRPIRDTQVYVLDGRMRPVPIGAVGELFIGGSGVARGYLGREDLTAERFLPDPYGPPGARLYRTGDLTRWLEDGNLEFVGRGDDQLKIRGFRIEPGEIEAILSRHPAVKSCVVMAREDVPGHRRLVAYATPTATAAPVEAAVLREFLGRTLPEHMVPAAFHWIPAMPVTSNGKVDRRALPAPPSERPDVGVDYVEPDSSMERAVAGAFSDVLGLARVGARDGFFDLGGDSLLAVRAVALLAKRGLDLPIASLFQLRTVEAIARHFNTQARPGTVKARPPPTRNGRGEIAIVGMAGRFPGASSVDELWTNVCRGVDSVTFFTDADLDPSIPESVRGDPSYVKARGIVADSDLFDAAFFAVSPKEAEVMDPQLRLLLETSWEALERSGHVPARFPGAIGVFAGKYFDFYWDEVVRTRPDVIEQLGDLTSRSGNDKHFVATRVAHKLDLTGPALSVHSACSTSLVAVCQAVQSLRSGECDLALAGGASITVPVRSGYLYQEGSMLSPDGHCRPFDARAAGTTFGDGVAMVVLRRLDDALADGDEILAVLRGAAINNDGANRASFTAPSVEGQAAVVTRALADAGVRARDISYVETHGTATPLGDPIEVEGLTRAFRGDTESTGFCAIGSVKSNVGHLVIAAGVTGVIKTAFALHHRLLPPTAHFQAPNPHIDFARSPFRVQSRLEAWPAGPSPRRAGVSSFGVGGTNAHVVLEEPPVRPAPDGGRSSQLLVLSARSPAALEAATTALRDHLRRDPAPPLADVAFTLQDGREAFAVRRCLVATDVADAVDGLRPDTRRIQTRRAPPRPPPVIFMFPGQGSQHVGMARRTYQEEPVFREAVDLCSAILGRPLGFDIREVLLADGDIASSRLAQTSITQPAIFTVSWSLARLWMAWGVRPVGMIGHSVGEFVAAVLGGVLSLEDGLELVAARGRLMQSLPAGSMLSVNLGAEEISARLRATPSLNVASDNAPHLCVVAGPTADVIRLQKDLDSEGVGCRMLVTSHAFHSAMMDPVVAPFTEIVRRVRLSPPTAPFVSTVTGTWIEPEQATDPTYWASHMRAPVRFGTGIRTLLADPGRVLLEVGPRATLSALARRQFRDPAVQVAIPSLGEPPPGRSDHFALLQAVGSLWLAGGTVEWGALHSGEFRRRVPLPTYPFERKRFWLERGALETTAASNSRLAAGPSSSSQPGEPPSTVLLDDTHSSTSAPAPPSSSESPLATTIASTSSSRLNAVREMFEEVTGSELANADTGATFLDLGLDSLFLTQAAIQVQKRFGIKVTFRQLMEDFTSLDALAAHLDARLPPQHAAPALAVASLPAAGSMPPPSSLPVPGGASPGTVQWLIEQQLRIMSQQLAALGGSVAPAGASPPPPEPATSTAPAPVPAPVRTEEASPEGVQKYDVKKAFGAIARISTHGLELSPLQRARLDALIRRYNSRTQGSKRLTQANRSVLADPRVVTGFKPATKELTYQVIVERSAGSRVWDVDGNEYVDVLCGFGACFFGWQPGFVTDAVRRQLDLGHEIGPMTPLAGEVARLLCEMTGFDRAGFCNTGSEAVMGTMRVARTVTGRSTVVTFGGSYHGIFDEVIVRGTKKLKSIPAAPGILPSAMENVLVLDYGTPEALETIRSRAGDLAAVLVEPVQSRRPDLRPREFLHEVRRITEASGTALIFDEVVNGFRTCPGGAQEYFGVRADLASYGKVVGGGFPIGIIAGRRDWADALDGGFWQYGDDSVPTVGVTYFAGTFCRHPLALAAARAVLLHLKERGPALQEEVSDRTSRLASDLNAHFESVKAPIHIKHFASLWKVTFTEDHPLSDLLFVYLRDRGVHILEGFPSFLTTAHSQDDVDFVAKAFRESVAEMQEAGFLPDHRPAPHADDASRPPVPGARLGRDISGKPAWYVPDPSAPGKYIRLDETR